MFACTLLTLVATTIVANGQGTVQPVTAVPNIPVTAQPYTVQPYTVQPYMTGTVPADTRILFSNNGFGFFPTSQTEVQWSQLQQLKAEQAWSYRQDRRIESNQYRNYCLSMNQQGAFSMCSCSQPCANNWEWHKNGYLYEKQWNKMVGMRNKQFFVQDYSDNVWDNNFLWSRWAIANRAVQDAASSYVQIQGPLQPAVPFSFRQSGRYMYVDESNGQYKLVFTQSPNSFQQQNWFYDNTGRIRNAIYNQCLAYRSNAVNLGPCDNTASYWDYNYEKKSLMERNSKKYFAYNNNNFAVEDYQQEQQKSFQWEAYRAATPLALVSEEAESSTNSASTTSSLAQLLVILPLTYLSSIALQWC